MDIPFMQKLNQAQFNAATCKSNAVQILAGPGSGKTRGMLRKYSFYSITVKINK